MVTEHLQAHGCPSALILLGMANRCHLAVPCRVGLKASLPALSPSLVLPSLFRSSPDAYRKDTLSLLLVTPRLCPTRHLQLRAIICRRSMWQGLDPSGGRSRSELGGFEVHLELATGVELSQRSSSSPEAPSAGRGGTCKYGSISACFSTDRI